MKKLFVLFPLLLLVSFFLYTVVSYHVFHKSTAISLPVNCMPQVAYEDGPQPKENADSFFIKSYKAIFGIKCGSY